ncbi:MAG: hypothetical protein ACP5O2_09385 [Bacteroidales bacterium]
MNLDMNEIFQGMLAAMRVHVTSGAKELEEYASRYMERRKHRLAEIARLYSEKIITADQMKEELGDEAQLLEAQLLATEAMGKAIAQKAANAAISFLTDYFLRLIKPL